MPLVAPVNNPYTVYVPPGGAAGDIQAAIDAMPAAGGIIQLGAGTYTPTSLVSATPDRSILIRGMGSVTAGADAPTVISYTGTGSGSFVTLPLTIAGGFRDLEIKYTNSAFSGVLVDLYGGSAAGADTTQFLMDNVVLWGPHAGTETATLLRVAQTTQMSLHRVDFNGGGIAIQGARVLDVTSVSVANPTTITTAQAHGWTTGNSIYFGGLTTSAAIADDTAYVMTSTGANTFTIPVNVASVTDGVGFAYNRQIDGINDAGIMLDTCEFRNQVTMPIKNIGNSWTIQNCNFEPLYNGDVAAISHDPGFRSFATTISGCFFIDQTTTTACTWIKWAGTALVVSGCTFQGRQTANDTAIAFDENGCDGFVIQGNQFGNMWKGLDFGSTTGHTHGTFLGNAFPNPHGSGTRVAGTLPNGIGLYPTAASTVPDGFLFGGSATATYLRFDGDIAANLVRSGAGSLYSDSALYMKGDIRAGYGATATTRLYGIAAGANAGMAAEGSNANIDIWVTPKGTGVVLLNWPGASSGAVRTVGQVQFQTTIAPTQLVANTDNWNPTNLAFCREIAVDIDAARTLTGIVAQTAGTEIVLSNKTAFDLTLAHDATSTAANRFWCPGAVNFTLRQKGSVLIRYNGTATRWQVVAG